MSLVVVSEAKTAIKKFRSRNVNTQEISGTNMNWGEYKGPKVKCFNVLSDYKRIRREIDARSK